MKRIGRWLLNGLAGLCLLFFIATVVLWVRSYWAWEMVDCSRLYAVNNETRLLYIEFVSIDHELHFDFLRCAGQGNQKYLGTDPRYISGPPNPTDSTDIELQRQDGFRFYCGKSPNEMVWGIQCTRSWEVELYTPYWFLAMVFLVLPVWRCYRLWPRKTVDGTFCATCGYDLRASPERCPECGTENPRKGGPH
jgi:hypothetical protein